MSIAYLLLGSNLGNRMKNLRKAHACLNDLIGETLKTSFVYESPSWGFEHPSRFLNQAVRQLNYLRRSLKLKKRLAGYAGKILTKRVPSILTCCFLMI
ncbi:MAG: 2-amino-4-hydroxy-6-hydroxymethyldihydropteridine diphosphokinase [Bacteroidales bacterium]|nr:2-amino-4-hydroxy-6-hydroxymethyldihydropteridine diphosphokinase [Bacteroidales bacterium]